VVVDAFCLGDEDNIELRTISYLSGGYKFKPLSLEEAMAICEMEPVLSQLERPTVAPSPEAHFHKYSPFLLVFLRACTSLWLTLLGDFSGPKTKRYVKNPCK
jgi:hypothetical protein